MSGDSSSVAPENEKTIIWWAQDFSPGWFGYTCGYRGNSKDGVLKVVTTAQQSGLKTPKRLLLTVAAPSSSISPSNN